MGICAGSASRMTFVPSRFNAPSKSGGPRYGPVPIIDELVSGIVPAPPAELGNPHITVALANLIAFFDHESFRECVREWDLEDLGSDFASEFECECVPVLVLPSLKLVLGFGAAMVGVMTTPWLPRHARAAMYSMLLWWWCPLLLMLPAPTSIFRRPFCVKDLDRVLDNDRACLFPNEFVACRFHALRSNSSCSASRRTLERSAR
jgi:hypothetical protein